MKPQILEFSTVSDINKFVIDIDGEDLTLEIEILKHEIENSGIGHYECHGFRGFDSGQDDVLVTDYRIVSVNGNNSPSLIEWTTHHFQKLWDDCKVEFKVDEVERSKREYDDY